MYFVEPNVLNRTGLAVGTDHGLSDKLSLGSRELAEDRARAFLHGWHDGVPQIRRIVRRWFVFERRGSRDERAAKIQELRSRDLENVSGSEMPVMLEGALKSIIPDPQNEKDHRSDRWSQTAA